MSFTNNGLRYYKRLQLWNYMSDFYNAVLLAKTFISFQKQGFFQSQSQIYGFFNSDLPISQPNDSHTPVRYDKDGSIPKRSCSAPPEHMLKSSKRRKIVPSVNAHDSIAFHQKVYDHILTSKCKSHLQRILNGTVACKR